MQITGLMYGDGLAEVQGKKPEAEFRQKDMAPDMRRGIGILPTDLAARKFAKSFGIALCGTIGVIVIAKKVGIISDVQLLLNRLIDMDFRIDDRLYQTALRLAGETS